ncbi:helix-turn-helix domain-containing protein [Streptacidiphilus sp. MAP5-52]|uniref:helix-turn-helix domain-containing protein n=1 Tax=Streptacidiphilus sp. MAP5-52 TaxID=3156267 RepID=UPI003519BC8F
MNADISARALPAARSDPGALIRHTRQAQGLTLVQLGARTGYSAAQVSRYERGISPLTDITVLARFADALGLPLQVFGLAPRPQVRHGHSIGPTTAFPRLPPSTLTGRTSGQDGEVPVHRRQLLANLAITAAAAVGYPFLADGTGPSGEEDLSGLMVGRLRDAMLGLNRAVDVPSTTQVQAELARALADFHTCQYESLATRLPWLIRVGHATTAVGAGNDLVGLQTQSYLLATRMLIKLDEQQLGWMAADRARQFAEADGDALLVAESARQLAVLSRRAGWHDQAVSIALTAADDPSLRGPGPAETAVRGLLVQSAAYTCARVHDRSGMRELTREAAAMAAGLGPGALLRDHGGGFSSATVALHLISAENSAGDPGAALAAARTIAPHALPSVERRARYYTDVATALGSMGRRDECVRALLAAEHHAPEETRTRPAVRSLVSGLLVSGRTTPDLRGLAARVGALV